MNIKKYLRAFTKEMNMIKYSITKVKTTEVKPFFQRGLKIDGISYFFPAIFNHSSLLSI